MVWYGGFTFVQAHQRSNKAAITPVPHADDTEVKGGCFAKAKLAIETATIPPTPPIRRSPAGEKYGVDIIDVSVVRYFCKG